MIYRQGGIIKMSLVSLVVVLIVIGSFCI